MEKLKKLKKLSYINWSDIIRDSVIKKLKEEKSRERVIYREAIAEGIEIASTVRKSPFGWNSTAEIRKWRDQKS